MTTNGRKWRLRAAAALVLFATGTAAAAEPQPLMWKAGEVVFKPFLSDRARVEVVDWFEPAPGAGDETYTFEANVIRFGTAVQWRDVQVTLEGQEVELWNVPDDAPGLGPGAAYYANTADRNQRELSVRRAVLQWNNAFVKGLGLSGGRFIFNDGLETTATDAGLQWLKRARISQRLLGAFDFTHTGRSFDGATARYTRAPWDLTLSGGRPTAGGFNISANNEVEEVAMVYGALTLTEPSWLPRSDGRLFYLYYEDERGLVATDNRPLADRQADGGDIAVHTVGANVETVQRLGPGDVDALLWIAGQGGDWESLDHAAWAISIEGGYRLVDVATRPWLRAGWYRGSGDDDPGDGDHGTFFQVLPTARQYAQTPLYNMMNNEDLFVQLMLAPAGGLNVRVDYHHLWVTEGDDLLYSGGGATQTRPSFGYGGFAARGHSNIGDLLDLSVDYTFNPHAKVGVYYGHVFGASVIDAQFEGSKELDYGYLEVTLSL